MKRPAIRKVSSRESDHATDRKDLSCACGRVVFDVAGNIATVTCWVCVAKMADPPTLPAKLVKPEEQRPRGWQFKSEYISPSGQVYHRGKLVEPPVVSTGKKKAVKITSPSGTS